MSIRKYSWKFRITAWLLIFIIVFLFVEGLSYLYLRIRLGPLHKLIVTNSALGYFYRPNAHIKFNFKEKQGDSQSKHEISINSKGLRNKEIFYEKAKNVYRILVLGDSIVFAHQVARERRFTEILEDELNRGNHQIHYEVINAGVNGYGTANELMLFTQEVVNYKPNLVILTFFVGNDVMDNSRILLRKEKPFFTDGPYFILGHGTLSLKNYPSASSVFARFSTYRLISNVTGKYVPGMVRWANKYGLLINFPLYGEYIEKGIPLHMHLYTSYNQEWLDAWDITKALIIRLRDEVLKYNAQFLVLIVPSKLQLGNSSYWEWTEQNFPMVSNLALDMKKPQKILHDSFLKNDIRFLDLLSVFQEHERTKGKPVYFKVDIHLNEQGHYLTAHTLLSFLNKGIYFRWPIDNEKNP